MKKLKKPGISAYDAYEKCIEGIRSTKLKKLFDKSKPEYSLRAAIYEKLAEKSELYTIKPLKIEKGEEPFVFLKLKKSNFIELYNYYFVKKQPARKIYDDIIVGAGDRCPYCGGIGRPGTLDHYLPMASYPQFSVLPTNLLPCCRDCNTESKKNTVSSEISDQVIHPYFDAPCFFDDPWIAAKIERSDPCSLVYFVNPPSGWSKVNRNRAKYHFVKFDLAKRYGVQAGEELATLLDQRKRFMKKLSAKKFSRYLSSIGNTKTLFVNHWKKIMYQTLAKDDWFCSNNF